jgi:hypothetical protein
MSAPTARMAMVRERRVRRMRELPRSVTLEIRSIAYCRHHEIPSTVSGPFAFRNHGKNVVGS